MTRTEVARGAFHEMPKDLKQALIAEPKAQQAWESLTSLARNEWICWNITVKQPATRKNHIERTVNELKAGKRRPCCWMGCVHRKDKELSASQKWILDKSNTKQDGI